MTLMNRIVRTAAQTDDPNLRTALLGILKAAASRSKKENEVAGRFPPDSKKGRGKNRTVMLTGDVAKVLGRKSYDRVKLSELSDSDLNKLHVYVMRKRG